MARQPASTAVSVAPNRYNATLLPRDAGPLASSHAHEEIDVMALLLADKRNKSTERAYKRVWKQFFTWSPRLGAGFERDAPGTVRDFCAWPPAQIARELTLYKQSLYQREMSPATVSQHISALTSLLTFAYRLGLSTTDGRKLVTAEKVESYRDTAGYSMEIMVRALELPGELHRDKDGNPNLKALRDGAMFHLLLEIGLRRAELCQMDVGDFSFAARQVKVKAKGKQGQKVQMQVSPDAAAKVGEYLLVAGHGQMPDEPLFFNLDHRYLKERKRLLENGLFKITNSYAVALGVPRLAPHQFRHASITAYAQAAGGDMVKVQAHSRHAKIETARRYIDNAKNLQGEGSNALAGLIRKHKKK